jgi:hypothetical protein
MLRTLYVKHLGVRHEAILHPVPLAIAAAGHDQGREDEGHDHWDELSARLARMQLLSMGYSEDEARMAYHSIAAKDPKTGSFDSNTQRVVHDADCLEIMRITHRAHFRPDNLACWKHLARHYPKREELLNEVAQFIELTEDPDLKKSFDRTEQDTYHALKHKVVFEGGVRKFLVLYYVYVY